MLYIYVSVYKGPGWFKCWHITETQWSKRARLHSGAGTRGISHLAGCEMRSGQPACATCMQLVTASPDFGFASLESHIDCNNALLCCIHCRF